MTTRMKKGAISGKTWQEDNWWFSTADKLPIAGFGKTSDEAMSRIMCSLRAYLEACAKDNELIAMMEHYDLIVEQESPPAYTFRFETPIEERESDGLVLAK